MFGITIKKKVVYQKWEFSIQIRKIWTNSESTPNQSVYTIHFEHKRTETEIAQAQTSERLLTVNACDKLTVLSSDQAVQEGERTIIFFFLGERDVGMPGVQKLEKFWCVIGVPE